MVKETELYHRLGVSPDATKEEIKRAFRMLAVKVDPARNPGDKTAEEKFIELREAYEVLSDEKKRKLYDRYGKKGLEKGGANEGVTFNNAFSSFFGKESDTKRGENSVNQMGVTLEDLYNGKKISIVITHNILCSECHGSGFKSGKSPKKCQTCDGRGIRMVRRQIGPMIRNLQMLCGDCQSTGEIIDDEDKCPKCNGKHVVPERKTLEIVVEPGMKNNQRITFAGESDQAPDMEPGDVVFVIKTQPHRTFKRSGDDLIMNKSITLAEALTGFKFTFEHLDKRMIMVESAPRRVVKPGDKMCIPEFGMPIRRKPSCFGKMIIVFDVVFPLFRNLQTDIAALRACLTPPSPPLVESVAPPKTFSETVMLETYDPITDRQDDEEGQEGQQKVQCAQQ